MNEDDDERSLIDDAKEDVQNKKKSSVENLSKMKKVLSKPNGAQSKIMAKAIAALGPIIPYLIAAVIIILIIIIVVGIIGFFLNMPGMLSGKINQIFSKVATSIKCIYETDADATTSDEDVLELADYIHSMDYDLIGYGFVKPDPFDNTKTVEYLEEQGYERVVEDIPADEQEENGPTYKVFLYKDKDSEDDKQQYIGSFYDVDGQEYNFTGLPKKYDGSSGDYTKYGITYDENGKVKDINDESSILRTYAVSNRRIYIIRNNDDIFYYKFAVYMNKLLNGYQGSWAQGLLELWNSENGVATDPYDLFDQVGVGDIKDLVSKLLNPAKRCI